MAPPKILWLDEERERLAFRPAEIQHCTRLNRIMRRRINPESCT